MLFCISAVSVFMFPFLFLILFIWVLSFFLFGEPGQRLVNLVYSFKEPALGFILLTFRLLRFLLGDTEEYELFSLILKFFYPQRVQGLRSRWQGICSPTQLSGPSLLLAFRSPSLSV